MGMVTLICVLGISFHMARLDVKNLGAKGRTRQVEGRTRQVEGRTRQVEGRSLAVRHKGQKTAPKLALALLGTALLACAPVVDNRGYVFDEGLVTKLQKNSMTMQQATGMLGSPSMRSSINGEALYYIHSVIVTESYRAPIETDRKVMALYFNADKVLQDYAVYGLRDGLIVPIVPRTTQSQGRELSFIEQIFGNLGRFDGDPTAQF
jgi:outer membrane protein assembly factor BamE (lipoprotein component of BamABCDE complex)